MNALPREQPHLSWPGPKDDSFQLQACVFPFINDLFHSRTLKGRDGQSIPLDVYIPAEEGQLLYSLVSYLAPNVSLEIGLANGVSALYIAQALQHNGAGRHLAIDPFQTSDWNEAGLVTLERAGLRPLVSLDPRPSHCALPELEQQGLRVQFAFIDGSHQFDYVIADFLGVDRILDVGGMIAFDDSDWPAITSVIRYALTNRAYEVFDVGMVIEPSPIRPRRISRGLRMLARRLPSLQQILRHEFVFPSHELGILGRCVVLRKVDHDDRDSQSNQFSRF